MTTLSSLVDKKIVTREIATARLLKLSKNVPEYNDDIKIAFIKVLKAFPREKNELLRRAYAQHILKWLNERHQAKDLDLNHCIFDNQDFEISVSENLFQLFQNKSASMLSFEYANLTKANLRGADLTNADLAEAIGLTIEQLNTASCLHRVIGLDNSIVQKLILNNKTLFEKAKG